MRAPVRARTYHHLTHLPKLPRDVLPAPALSWLLSLVTGCTESAQRTGKRRRAQQRPKKRCFLPAFTALFHFSDPRWAFGVRNRRRGGRADGGTPRGGRQAGQAARRGEEREGGWAAHQVSADLTQVTDHGQGIRSSLEGSWILDHAGQFPCNRLTSARAC